MQDSKRFLFLEFYNKSQLLCNILESHYLQSKPQIGS